MSGEKRFWSAVCLHPTHLSEEEYERAFEYPGSADYPFEIVRCLRPVDHNGPHRTDVSSANPALWLDWDLFDRAFWIGEVCTARAVDDEPTYEQYCWLSAGHTDPHDFDYRPALNWPFPHERFLHPRARADLDQAVR